MKEVPVSRRPRPGHAVTRQPAPVAAAAASPASQETPFYKKMFGGVADLFSTSSAQPSPRRSKLLLPLRPKRPLRKAGAAEARSRRGQASRSRTRTDPPDHHTCKSPPHRRAFCLGWPSWLLKRLFIGSHEKRRLVRRRPWDQDHRGVRSPEQGVDGVLGGTRRSPSRAGPFRRALSPSRSGIVNASTSLKLSRPPQICAIWVTRSSMNFMEPTTLLMRWPVMSWKLQASKIADHPIRDLPRHLGVGTRQPGSQRSVISSMASAASRMLLVAASVPQTTCAELVGDAGHLARPERRSAGLRSRAWCAGSIP